MRVRPMLEDVKPLPCAKGEPPGDEGNAQAGLRESRSDVRCHIVWSFRYVPVAFLIFGHQAFKEVPQI